MLEAAHPHPGFPRAARRAAVFGAVLVVVGVASICLRVLESGLHPQLVLFLYSIPANSAVSLFSHEVALLDYGSHQPILLTEPRYLLLAWPGREFQIPEWVLLALLLAVLVLAPWHQARAPLDRRKPP